MQNTWQIHQKPQTTKASICASSYRHRWPFHPKQLFSYQAADFLNVIKVPPNGKSVFHGQQRGGCSNVFLDVHVAGELLYPLVHPVSGATSTGRHLQHVSLHLGEVVPPFFSLKETEHLLRTGQSDGAINQFGAQHIPLLNHVLPQALECSPESDRGQIQPLRDAREDLAEDEALDFLFKVRQDGQHFLGELPRVGLGFVLGQVWSHTVGQSHFNHFSQRALADCVTLLHNNGVNLLKVTWDIHPMQIEIITAQKLGRTLESQVQTKIQKLHTIKLY